jgi:hypothetical protein
MNDGIRKAAERTLSEISAFVATTMYTTEPLKDVEWERVIDIIECAMRKLVTPRKEALNEAASIVRKHTIMRTGELVNAYAIVAELERAAAKENK